MIRIVLFLIVVGAASLGVAWLADRPGEVVITWQGLQIATSLIVLVASVLMLMAILALVWSLVRAALRSPGALANRWRSRRGERAYEAISNGLVAVGAGDIAAARRHAAEVNRLAPHEPLTLLLAAQAAQLDGDREAAERTFRVMAGRSDTKALGLHGLHVEAQRRGDLTAAQAYAEEAARTAPSLAWAGKAVLELRCATGDWAGALELLERAKSGLDKAVYQRRRALMLTARALALEDSDRDSAKAFILEAVKLAPTLAPAAALAGRFLAEGGELRRASRIVAKAWRANPHPDLAQTYANLRFGDSARDRLARIEALVKRTPGNIESALAVARAALDARDFGKARAALAAHLSAPTRRIALMMAELERAERNDEGRAREWMARALNATPDPRWTADGYVSDRWLPVSPVTGRLDAFEWRVPLTGIVSAPMIEPEARPAPATAPADTAYIAATAVQPPPQSREAMPSLPSHEVTASAPPPSPPPPLSSRPATPTPPASPPVEKQPKAKAEAVIPLVHAPDDPGPEIADETEQPPHETQRSGWRKIFD